MKEINVIYAKIHDINRGTKNERFIFKYASEARGEDSQYAAVNTLSSFTNLVKKDRDLRIGDQVKITFKLSGRKDRNISLTTIERTEFDEADPTINYRFAKGFFSGEFKVIQDLETGEESRWDFIINLVCEDGKVRQMLAICFEREIVESLVKYELNDLEFVLCNRALQYGNGADILKDGYPQFRNFFKIMKASPTGKYMVRDLYGIYRPFEEIKDITEVDPKNDIIALYQRLRGISTERKSVKIKRSAEVRTNDPDMIKVDMDDLEAKTKEGIAALNANLKEMGESETPLSVEDVMTPIESPTKSEMLQDLKETLGLEESPELTRWRIEELKIILEYFGKSTACINQELNELLIKRLNCIFGNCKKG